MVFDTWFGIFVPLFLEYKAELHKTHTVGGTTLTESQVDAILSALVFYGVAVPIYYQLRPHLKDENDNMVFECAGQIPAKIGAYAAPAVHEGGIPRLPPHDDDFVVGAAVVPRKNHLQLLSGEKISSLGLHNFCCFLSKNRQNLALIQHYSQPFLTLMRNLHISFLLEQKGCPCPGRISCVKPSPPLRRWKNM